jgi:hypothetical protein
LGNLGVGWGGIAYSNKKYRQLNDINDIFLKFDFDYISEEQVFIVFYAKIHSFLFECDLSKWASSFIYVKASTKPGKS